ncbi:MAG TPA: RNA polymerase sigma factor SigZ [Bacteroidales bacterium]|nr:RNA polymerase sigma factor SigZ [Bacteroidales bacterium]
MNHKIEKIWQNLNENLRLFIWSKIPDKADAEDLLQEVFLKIHSNIDTLKDETKVKSWIYQITRNLITDYYRRPKRTGQMSEQHPETEQESQSDEFMDEALNDMISMMDQLSDEQCKALCMTEIDGLSQLEYAQKVGISYTAAKSRIQRSRKLLKDMLMNCCHYEFDKYGTVLNITPHACCCCCPEEHS